MPLRKLLALIFSLCLLAGCAAGNTPAVSGSVSAPPEPPAAAGPAPEFPPEDTGGLLTLYAYEPATGHREMLHRPDRWQGNMTLEAVSPSGDRLLAATNLGGEGFRVTAILSLWDRGRDRVFSLRRPEGEERAGDAELPGAGRYRFLDEDTLLYTNLLLDTGSGRAELRRYRIGEDGALIPQAAALDCPPLAAAEYGKGGVNVFWLPERQAVTARLCTEAGWEWLTWGAESGELLFRSPAENTPRRSGDGLLKDGVIYDIAYDWQGETFALRAYHMAEDRAETLAAGPIPADPAEEKGALGYWLDVSLEEIREDAFLLRAWYSLGPPGWREAVWAADAGGSIEFAEERHAPPALPAEWREPAILGTLPDGRLLVLAGA